LTRTSPFTVLIVGTGGIGRRHAATVRACHADAEFLAVRSEPSEATESLGMKLVADLETGLAANPDAAIVALPPAMHAETASKILAAGIPLYLEKPVATHCADLQPAFDEAEARNIITMVGFNLRFVPGLMRVKDILDAGDLGAPRHARMSIGQWLPDWRPGRDYRETYSAKRALGGGVFYDLIHEIDLARFFFGEFDHVDAVAGNSGALEIDSIDYADIILQRRDFSAAVHLDYLDRSAHRAGRIVCAHGTIAYDVTDGTLDIYEAATGEWRRLAGPEAFVVAEAAPAAIHHFLDCLKSGQATRQPIGEGLRSLALAELAIESGEPHP